MHSSESARKYFRICRLLHTFNFSVLVNFVSAVTILSPPIFSLVGSSQDLSAPPLLPVNKEVSLDEEAEEVGSLAAHGSNMTDCEGEHLWVRQRGQSQSFLDRLHIELNLNASDEIKVTENGSLLSNSPPFASFSPLTSSQLSKIKNF